jgi:long-chain acyl-CoA synthetase
MRRETLIDFFDDLAALRGPFLVYDNGFRTRTFSYAEVARAARTFAAQLDRAGISKGDTVIFWSENRPEWIAALWGCVLQGVVAVPLDYRASGEFLRRVQGIVKARVVLVGDEVELGGFGEGVRPPGDVVRPDAVGIRPPEGSDRRQKGSDPFVVWRFGDFDWVATDEVPRARVERDDTAEIIFTSGATAEPKGVVITHRNLLANIVPVEREVMKYRKYARPFAPIRFLNLLPLSHMFGQSMATFVPPMLGGVVLFMRGYNPHEIVRQVKDRRVSVIVSVPKILDVLREHVLRIAPEAAVPPPRKEHYTRRWWRYRRVHRTFGLKFWSFVVGAAPLDPALEEFWGRLGFLVVQGYGLTETAPIVSLNHPFSTSRGSVGKAIAGVEVKIADDGEILVRGENVTKGYFGEEAGSTAAFEDDWFHTGDVGEIDTQGRLFIRGRKKEMIVTPEGLNFFPEDVERVVAGLAGVRDVAVVGKAAGSEERVYAVVVLDPGRNPQEVVREANARLPDHQKLRGISLWPGDELPRTEGTRKLKRRVIRDWLTTGTGPTIPASGTASVAALVSHYAGGRALAPGTTIDELGLSSLERIELMVALEEKFGTTIDETAFGEARDVAALETLVRQAPAPSQESAETFAFPSWNRSWPVRIVRNVSLATWLFLLTRVFARTRVEGLEHLKGLDTPVIFAANHQSHMDTPVVLAALPGRWRYHVATAMAKEFFKAHFFPEQVSRRQWFTNSLNYYLASCFFNTFPLPQREAGARQTLRYIGELLGDGWSVLIFPEGKRTERGEVNPFQPGIGMIGSRLTVPVVPVRLEGLDRVLHRSARMATPGRVRVSFGAPIHLAGDDYAALARRVEDAVRSLERGQTPP